ncbi:conserved unknown protein [Ectocarpus siliculosus]|uniref:Uncharacterized protein n=1 Tax=Ectocarpus siliculosus TaxID=2880 RepID=D7FH17_ECTSI|nr:conserved unknown protein [Ectocarpus siliculosus]|eukprot:CBJ28395.1 conserved unknown protein [Ectocarpus siliculosus]
MSTATVAAGVPKSDWSLPTRPGLQIEDENEYAGAANAAPVLYVEEAEHFVESLREFSIEEIGNSSWFEQNRRLAKLNLQAHQSAMARSDEYVLEALLTFDKLGVVVHELLAIEAWKEFVLPRLLETERARSGKCTMRLYFTLYHEATLANLLQVALFHGHICEQAGGDLLMELADYCARKMTMLISGRASSKPRNAREVAKDIEERLAKLSPAEEVRGYQEETEFRVCVTAVALLRFLCEHLHRLPLGVMTRVLDTHDVLLGLVILVENPPWTRRAEEGTWQKFVDFEWRTVAAADLLQVTKTEGQVWLAMYHLMCEEECRKRYHFNSLRKNNILRVRKYLNDILLDQLPVLASVQRYMDELTIMEVPEPPSMGTTGSLLMEQIPKVRQSLTRGHDWDALALRATSKRPASGGGGGAFCTYDDADDPDVKSAAALFSAGELEDWGGGAGEGQLEERGAVAASAEKAAAAVEAVRAAKAEAGASREKDWGGGSGGAGGRGGEAPSSSVRA